MTASILQRAKCNFGACGNFIVHFKRLQACYSLPQLCRKKGCLTKTSNVRLLEMGSVMMVDNLKQNSYRSRQRKNFTSIDIFYYKYNFISILLHICVALLSSTVPQQELLEFDHHHSGSIELK